MSMPAAVRIWTPDEVRALQDPDRARPRYELLDGELLVTPGPEPKHQTVVGELFYLLRAYLDKHPAGEVRLSPADVALDVKTVLQPDVFVVPAPTKVRRWPDIKSLLLAVEVLSPGSIRADRVSKRRYFQRQGVPECWIVDVDARLIERWRPDDGRPEILTDCIEWQPDATAPALVIEVPALFRRVVD